MEDLKMLEAVERYIRGEMKPDERVYFEQLRKTNPEVDQLVVEHTLFIHNMNEMGERRKFRSTLNDVHTNLAEKGLINSDRLKGNAKVVYLWKKYKRVAAIAASIAGITTLTTSLLVWSLSPKPDKKIQDLSRDLEKVKKDQIVTKAAVNNLQNNINTQFNPHIPYKSGGSGFLIDGKGLLITNLHVVRNARNIAVQNKKGEIFTARVIFSDIQKDLAILKVDDNNFKSLSAIPYNITKASTDLAEPIFTLGYPRDSIVYGQGYLSANTGHNGDTLSCQITIAANPGNSGGPVLNRNGEVIGILSTRQVSAEGVVFAIQAKYIHSVLSEVKKTDTSYLKVKTPVNTSLKGLDRTQQVKKIEDYVFMVKVN
ncbi:MAG TPA: serine protease [Chitinophagaceae bacterium]|nr:serine protease [Chitinophagaceae bacterium]